MRGINPAWRCRDRGRARLAFIVRHSPLVHYSAGARRDFSPFWQLFRARLQFPHPTCQFRTFEKQLSKHGLPDCPHVTNTHPRPFPDRGARRETKPRRMGMANTGESSAARWQPGYLPRLLMHHAGSGPTAGDARKEYGIWQTYTWAEVAERVPPLPAGWLSWASSAATAWRWSATTGRGCTGRWRPASAWRHPGDDVSGRRGPGDVYVMVTRRSASPASRTRSRWTRCSRSRGRPAPSSTSSTTTPRPAPYNQTFLHGLDEVREMGRIHDRNHPDFLGHEIDKGSPTTCR